MIKCRVLGSVEGSSFIVDQWRHKIFVAIIEIDAELNELL
jgi:hypothetical protein